MNHPRLPLFAEQTAAIIEAGTDAAKVARIRAEYEYRRNTEFPGWAERYDAEVDRWANHHGAGRRS